MTDSHTAATLLQATQLHKSYGAFHALKGIDLQVRGRDPACR